jgi:hypothetical protein
MVARLTLYRKYRPVRGKAPIIHTIMGVLKKEGVLDDLGLVSELSGVSRSAIVGWKDGDTVAPRTETAGAVLSSLGYEITVRKTEVIDIDKELQLAAKWLLERNEGRRPVKRNANGHKG